MDADYIVVGAGSAGCILAAGLSEGGKNSVILLEAGPTDRHPYVKIPLGYGLLFHDKVRNYQYYSVEEPALNGRQIYIPRGKTVGGSGSINALVYFRGMPADFESWKSEGLTNWGWENVRPYFEANERRNKSDTGITITDPVSERHPFTKVFSQAAAELNVRVSDDFNGPNPEGVGYYHITTRSGFRNTSADSFLRPALRKNHVRLLTGATAQKINITNGVARSVAFIHKGKLITATARRGIILSAGAINSPQLLQVSGIGDPEHLRQIGVETVLENLNVGAHLQDHLFAGYQYKTNQQTLNGELYSLTAKTHQVLRYFLTRGGPLSNSVNQFGGFVRSSSKIETPNIQLYFNPATYTISRQKGGVMIQPDPFSGFTLGFQPTRPTSRGSVKAMSVDISKAPEIKMNPISTNEDINNIVAGGRYISKFVQSNALSSVISGHLSPSPDTMSDAEILEDFRERSSSTFHPCGTCRMGTKILNSVVDGNLKVHGLERLFVVDASVFPSITSGNTNAPTLMVARYACDLILRTASATE